MNIKKVTKRKKRQRKRPVESDLDKQLANEKLRSLDLSGVAIDLIKGYNLEKTPPAKRVLKHELQIGLLKNVVEKDRIPAETLALKFLEKSLTIERVLWETRETLVPLDKAVTCFEAGLELVKGARMMRVGEKNIEWGRIIRGFEKGLEKLRQSEARMDASPERRRAIQKTSLFFATRLVDKMVNVALRDKRSYFIGTGFATIDGIVKWAFKDVKK